MNTNKKELLLNLLRDYETHLFNETIQDYDLLTSINRVVIDLMLNESYK